MLLDVSKPLRESACICRDFSRSTWLSLFHMKTIFILQQASSGLTTPLDYVKELQRVEVTREHLLKTLQSVRVSLTGRPIR